MTLVTRLATTTLASRISQARSFVDSLADTNQFAYAVFGKLDPWEDTAAIASISQTNPAVVISYDHKFKNGDVVTIAGVGGMTQINGYSGSGMIVANVTRDSFVLTGVDATSFSSYTGGGTIHRNLENDWPAPKNGDESVRREAFFAKRILPADVCHVISRRMWARGTTYDVCDYADSDLKTKAFYIVNSSNRIYKCLWNNAGSQSTAEPVSTSLSPFVTTDGYVWKFMCEVNSTDDSKFGTSNWIPVRTLIASDGSLQWSVQSAAIPGTIDAILVNSAGTGYDETASVKIVGDGIGATAAIPTSLGIGSGGQIVKLSMSDRGKFYRTARVVVTHPTGARFSGRAIISPPNGHGSDPVSELLANVLSIDVETYGDENTTAMVDVKFRKIGIVKSPIIVGGSAAIALRYDLRTTAVLTDATGFSVGDKINNGKSFSATIRTISGSTTLLTDCSGLLSVGDNFTNGIASSTVTSVISPSFKVDSGDLTYIEHRSPTTRRSNRSDRLRALIEF